MGDSSVIQVTAPKRGLHNAGRIIPVGDMTATPAQKPDGGLGWGVVRIIHFICRKKHFNRIRQCYNYNVCNVFVQINRERRILKAPSCGNASVLRGRT
jgi:hypothetical protein